MISRNLVSPVSKETYLVCLADAQRISERVRSATTPAAELSAQDFYLSADGLSGFAITSDSTLVGLFSVVKGRGKQLVQEALHWGALHLDCFDGYLPTWYGTLGFYETGRVSNYTAGGPDVVFMTHVTHNAGEGFEA